MTVRRILAFESDLIKRELLRRMNILSTPCNFCTLLHIVSVSHLVNWSWTLNVSCVLPISFVYKSPFYFVLYSNNIVPLNIWSFVYFACILWAWNKNYWLHLPQVNGRSGAMSFGVFLVVVVVVVVCVVCVCVLCMWCVCVTGEKTWNSNVRPSDA